MRARYKLAAATTSNCGDDQGSGERAERVIEELISIAVVHTKLY